MQDEKERLIHLHAYAYTSRKLIRTILSKDPTLEMLYESSPKVLQQNYHLPSHKASHLYSHLHSVENQKRTRDHLDKYHTLTFFDDDYPRQLLAIPDPPPVLYVAGFHERLKQMPSISVVGTRKCSTQALNKMKHILSPLIQAQWVIVSGLAKGIDTLAHQIAIEQQGSTIGVLAFGFEHCYPKQNQNLMREMARRHVVISEYPPHIPPQKWHFPERNRIISGLSYGTLVVEAKERSGSLITADQALEQGREVYALPDSIFNSSSKGCHQLIQMGAKLVQNTHDLSEDWEEIKGNWCRFMSNHLSS